MRSCITLVGLIAISCVLGAAQAAAAPASERALTKKEVVELYEGKSWIWNTGVAFFAAKGQFKAFTEQGKNRSTVAGTWEATDEGRLCFAGVWTAKTWRRSERTCFAHKIKDGQLYPRRMPKGEWYIFRHDPAQEEDQKLLLGDQTR
jgi:hypothetical protein